MGPLNPLTIPAVPWLLLIAELPLLGWWLARRRDAKLRVK
jgi:hypothetical protein